MSPIITLIIQLISGVVGGNLAGSGMKNASLGTAGNTIVGALGGLGLGQLLGMVIPALAAGGGSLDIGALIGQIAGGGVGGAVLTAIVGMIKNQMSPAR
jgi:hypothetical protein